VNPSDNLPEVYGLGQGHRRMVRITRSQELALRAGHRRFAAVIRASVLVLFGLAMVVYPIFGTLSPAARAVGKVPGVVIGKIPETIEVVLGETPPLPSATPDLPEADDISHWVATSSNYIVSSYLPDCDGTVEFSDAKNGMLPADDLCVLWDGRNYLRADAAVAFAELNHAFKLKFGRSVCVESTYRSYSDQIRVKSLRGYLAAPVGTSNHGWGLAVDVCRGDSRGEYRDWFLANGPAFGWISPGWATTVKYEPWHYEYLPGTEVLGTNFDGEPGAVAEVPDTSVTPEPSASPSAEPEPSPSPSPEPS
jgi:D-alanyl-D-alanine carboxypeptidase